jgi:hypothetical protein
MAGTLGRIRQLDPTEWWVDACPSYELLNSCDKSQPQTLGETLSKTWIRQTSAGSKWQHRSLRSRLLNVPLGLLLPPIASWTPGIWLPGHVYLPLCRIESLLFRIMSPAAPYWTQRRSWACYLTTAMKPLKCLSSVCAFVSATLHWPISFPFSSSLFQAAIWPWLARMSYLRSSLQVLMPFILSF